MEILFWYIIGCAISLTLLFIRNFLKWYNGEDIYGNNIYNSLFISLFSYVAVIIIIFFMTENIRERIISAIKNFGNTVIIKGRGKTKNKI